MYNPAEAADRIKQYAKSKKISVTQMLEECELNKNVLSTMLSRGSMPKADNIARIADYLDCSVDYLLGRTDNPKAHLAPKDIEYESAVGEIYESPKKLMKARLAAYKAARDEERRQAIQAYRESLFSEEWERFAAAQSARDEAQETVKKAVEAALE